MSDEKPKEPVNYGDQVVVQKPKKEDDKKGGTGAPGVIILILVIAMFLLLSSPTRTSGPTPESREGTPVTSFPCEEGIEIGKSVDVVYKSVRVRKSAGYVNKNDAQDTIHYLKTGDKAAVKAGPTKKDGLCWWKLEHEGVEGWTADHSHEGRLLLQAGQ